MRKALLVCIFMAAALWLSGCMVISSEEHRHAGHARVLRPPPRETVRVIHAPAPPPRPHPPYRYPHGWR